jgi:hypothetical protein
MRINALYTFSSLYPEKHVNVAVRVALPHP